MKFKYITLIAALVLFCNLAQSQAKKGMPSMVTTYSNGFADTVVVGMPGMEKVIIVERNDAGKIKKVGMFDREAESGITFNALFDIGFNTYSGHNIFTGSDNDDFLDLNTTKSVNVAVYPIMATARLTNNRVLNIQTGLGVDWGNYRFEDGWTIANENGHTIASDKYRVGGESTVSKSKLMTVYMNVPLMLKVRIPVGSNPYNSFYISAGVIGGLKLGSHTKVKFNDGDEKEKDHNSFNLNLLRYDLTLRAGYRNLGLYVNYQMSPMFECDKGPKLFPYSAGVSVTI